MLIKFSSFYNFPLSHPFTVFQYFIVWDIYLWISDSCEYTIKELLNLLEKECWSVHSQLPETQHLQKQTAYIK